MKEKERQLHKSKEDNPGVKSVAEIYNPLLKNQHKFIECDFINDQHLDELGKFRSFGEKTTVRLSISSIKKFSRMTY